VRFEPHCKICKSDYAKALLYLHHCQKYSYRQLIKRDRHVLSINEYNLSTHFHRHVEQSDIDEVEQLKLQWSKTS